MTDQWWSIRLRSKFTGQEIHLGVAYATREEAEVVAAQQCLHCNSVDIIPTTLGPLGLNAWYEDQVEQRRNRLDAGRTLRG